MKHFQLFALLLFATATFAQKNQGLYSPLTEKVTANAVNENWLAEAQRVIKETEFAFKQDKNSGSFYTANLVQHLGISITASGYKVVPQKIAGNTYNVSNWQQLLSFACIIKGNTLISAGTAF